MASFAEQIEQRLQLRITAARDAYGQAWAQAAQAANPARQYPIRYEPGYVFVPLIPWFLSHGTVPHNIPHAFGYPLPFGTSGRFAGMFHPGIAHPSHFVETARDDATVRAVVHHFPDLLFAR